MTAKSRRRGRKKKRVSARKRRVKTLKKISRRLRARPTRAHEGGRRRRKRLRTKDLLEEDEV